jgi:hypothetical protein
MQIGGSQARHTGNSIDTEWRRRDFAPACKTNQEGEWWLIVRSASRPHGRSGAICLHLVQHVGIRLTIICTVTAAFLNSGVRPFLLEQQLKRYWLTYDSFVAL